VASGVVGCSGGSFNAGEMDASLGGAANDAPERIIVVVPADEGGADSEDDSVGLDATLPEAAASTDAADASDEPSHCSCTTPHADTSTCDVDGACVETRCAAGYLDCDGNRSNGCETEFNTLNCGACGTFCNPANVFRSVCSSGIPTCTYNACLPGYRDCDGDASDGCETPSDSGACP
jgi:hypothetical protein